jgi:PAS domain S-box-containing protein
MNDQSQKMLLLVEDEYIIALSEKMTLEKHGYSIISVSSGEQAIETMKGQSTIDLILMDIDLGKGIDGTEAAEQILKNYNIPIVFLSSHIEPEIVEKTEKITSYGYVVKNSGITILDASIKMAFKLFEANEKTKSINNKLEATLDALPDLMFEVGLDGYYYDFHSSNPELLYNSDSNFIGKNIKDFLPHDISDILFSAILEAHDTGVSRGKEYEMTLPIGKRWFEVSGSRMADIYQEPHFILLSRDITERKHMEDALRVNEENLARAEKIAGIGNWKLFLNTKEMTFSKGMLSIFGIDNENMLLEDIRKVDLPEYSDLLDNALNNLITKNIPYDIEFKIRRPNDNRICDIHSVANYDVKNNTVFGVIQDITFLKKSELEIKAKNEELSGNNEEMNVILEEMKATNDELMATNEKLNAQEKALSQEQIFTQVLLDSIPGILYVYDEQGSLIHWNKKHEEMTGYSTDELSHMTLPDFHSQEEMDEVLKAVDDVWEKGYGELESFLKLKNGKLLPMRYNGVRFSVDGKSYFTGIGLNISENKLTQDLLVSSEIQYRRLFETAKDGILILDADSGKIVDVNPFLINLLGYTKELFLDKAIWDIGTFQNIISNQDNFLELKEREYIRYDNLPLETSTGKTIQVEFVSSVYLAGKKKVIQCNIRDITARKRIEEKLAASNEMFQTVLDNIPQFIGWKDLNSRYLGCNKNFAYKAGLNNTESIIGKTDRDLPWKEEETENILRDDKRVMESGITEYHIFESALSAQGTETLLDSNKIPLHDINGKVNGILISCENITKMKQTEEFLENRTVFLESIINSSVDGILVVNDRREKIFQNQRIIELLGIPEDLADNKDDQPQLIYVESIVKNQDQFRERVAYLYNHIQEISKDEIELNNGTVLDRYSSPVLGKDGKYYGRIWVFHDITKVKEKEVKINNLLKEEELILKEVHHRIKNNMATICSLLSLQAGSLKDPIAIKAIENAEGRIRAMLVLYNKLYQSTDYFTVSISEYLPSLINEILYNFSSSISITVMKTFDNFTLDSKILQSLGIIVNELLTNIMKYAFAGKDDGLISISASLKNNTVSIIICDNGIGMPESVDFDHSTGFGLMLVGALTKQLNGTIRIERENGTKIILEFENRSI